jgi:hypothetical protein
MSTFRAIQNELFICGWQPWLEEGEALVKLAADQGHAYAMYALAGIHHVRKEYEMAVEWATKAGGAMRQWKFPANPTLVFTPGRNPWLPGDTRGLRSCHCVGGYPEHDLLCEDATPYLRDHNNIGNKLSTNVVFRRTESARLYERSTRR